METETVEKKKMRPVGFMMRDDRNYEKIFSETKAELASAPQTALTSQYLCGFSRLALQGFRPVRGLILVFIYVLNRRKFCSTCKAFAP